MSIFVSAKASIFELIGTIDFFSNRSEVLRLVHGARSRFIFLIHFKGPTLATRYVIATVSFEEVSFVVLIILVWYVSKIVSITLLNALKAAGSFDGVDGLALGDCVLLWHVGVHAWGVLAHEI